LMVAAERGHTAVVKAFLDKGADVHAQDERGAPVVMIAAEKGHADTVRALRTATQS
jgi:ankyrin repeat protein